MNPLQNMAYGHGAQTFVPQAAQVANRGEHIQPWLHFDQFNSRLDDLGLHRPGYVPETPEQIARLFERLYPASADLQPFAAAPDAAAAFLAQQSEALRQLEKQVQLLQQAILWQGAQLGALARQVASPSGGSKGARQPVS